MINYGLNFIFDENMAREQRCFPLGFNNEMFVIACLDPAIPREAITDVCRKNKIDQVQYIEQKNTDIERLINSYYTIEIKDKNIYKSIRRHLAEGRFEDLFYEILEWAIKFRASDIHIHTENQFCFIKFRINGRIKTFSIIESEYGEFLGRVIKVQANSDISKIREPSDARISVAVKGESLDIRVAMVSTISGEKISLRLLNNENIPKTIEELGISEREIKTIRSILLKSSGTILVTGPTGSGKSTTVRCFLNEINDGTSHIVTVEDPIEYKISGITQMQIDEKSGNSFDQAVKSVLRQDPDIIYIGEIRDEISASVATKASITGHLVFSTLHTKTAASAIQRLENLGVDRDLMLSSLLLIINQRLIAEQCPDCRGKVQYSGDDIKELDLNTGDLIDHATGCQLCDYSGIRRRVPLMSMINFEEDPELFDNMNAAIQKDKEETIDLIRQKFQRGEIAVEEAKKFI